MKRTTLFKEDINLVDNCIETLRYLETKKLKDDAGVHLVNTDNSIKELLWLKHRLKGLYKLYAYEEMWEDKK